MMRHAHWSIAAWLVLALAPLARGATTDADTIPQGREQLVETWRLISITRITPQGPQSDPFYGEHCSGLLIYDPSGWMSVQIAAGTRARVPRHRRSHDPIVCE